MIDQNESVRRAIEANLTDRFRRLDSLESHVDGRQYDGLRSWWDDSVPAWERRPCIRYSIIANAIRDNVSLLAGESRFPRITSRPAESDVLTDTGLDADKSAVLDAHIRALSRVTRYRAHIRAQLRAGQSCGTEVGIFGIRNGKPYAEATKAKWCEPEFDLYGNVVKLKIQYCFTRSVRGPDGKPIEKAYIYRRIIDDLTDRAWEGEAKANGQEPSWKALKDKSEDHNLGFCPVVWGPFLAECETHEEIDGHSIHDENAAELLHALDIALSQRHRSALFLEPQWTETGVAPGYSPTETGRAPEVAATVKGGQVTTSNPAMGSYGREGRGKRGQRKKGPGHVWQYADPAVKVDLHQANADALKAISDHVSDLEAKLAEALAVVFLDPSRVKYAAAMSGRALKILRQRQIDRADEIRDDFGVAYMIPAICMLLRIEAVCMARGEAVYVPGADQVKPILMGMIAGSNGWTPPDLTLVWGPYADSDPAEDELTMKMIVESKGIVPRHALIAKAAPIYGIEDVSAAIEELDAESAEAAQKQRDQFAIQAETEATAYHAAAKRVGTDTQQSVEPSS